MEHRNPKYPTFYRNRAIELNAISAFHLREGKRGASKDSQNKLKKLGLTGMKIF